MRETPTRSLLLVDANPEERRLISAIAARAGWSTVGAADEETAVGLLQGPHGRDPVFVAVVQVGLLGVDGADHEPQPRVRGLRAHAAGSDSGKAADFLGFCCGER